MVTEQHGLSDFNNGLIDCGSCGMVFYRGVDGNLCRCNHPHSDHGWCPRGGEVSNCGMVTPELEENVTMDEVLSDIGSVCPNGNYVSGYLRFSVEGASGAFNSDWWYE